MDLCSYYNNNKILIYYNDKYNYNFKTFTDFLFFYNGHVSYVYELKNKYFIYFCDKKNMTHELLTINKNIDNYEKYYDKIINKFKKLNLNNNKLFILNNKELQYFI